MSGQSKALDRTGLPEGALVRIGLIGRPFAYWVEEFKGKWLVMRAKRGKRGWEPAESIQTVSFPCRIVGTGDSVRVEQLSVAVAVQLPLDHLVVSFVGKSADELVDRKGRLHERSFCAAKALPHG